MALTITVAELAAAVRVTASAATPPAEPQLSILHRQLRVAEALIEDYANAAPDDVKNEAAIRMVGYLYDAPPANPSRNVSTPESSFRNSGALALLSRWHSLEYARVDGPTDVPVSIPESNINPSHPVHPGTHYRYAGWSDNGMIDQAELDAAAQFTGDVLTVPNRATSGYFFFGVDETPGYPDSIILDGTPTNQIQAYIEQPARLTRETNTVIIGVTASDQSPLLSGRTLTLGYASP